MYTSDLLHKFDGKNKPNIKEISNTGDGLNLKQLGLVSWLNINLLQNPSDQSKLIGATLITASKSLNKKRYCKYFNVDILIFLIFFYLFYFLGVGAKYHL